MRWDLNCGDVRIARRKGRAVQVLAAALYGVTNCPGPVTPEIGKLPRLKPTRRSRIKR